MLVKNAPKDPTAKGSSFYICMQKDVSANPTPDGKGVQHLFLSDGRIESFAEIVGNIKDKDMLSKLKYTEDFKTMIAGVGVSVEAENQNQTVNFAFQMYGKRDVYETGTTFNVTCIPDGMEHIVWLDDIEWSDDDDVIGQMRFEFEKPGESAVVNVKLYLREGYEAPEQEEVNKVDFDSQDYIDIIKKSFMQSGNNYRLKKFIDKAKSGEKVVMSFIGGSITQGAGAIPINTKCYAYQTWEQFSKEFGNGDNVQFIKAGIGGTPSELGMIRFDRDILRDGAVQPDLVVVEFAVNDEDDETKGACYESLIRKILGLSDETAVLLVFSVFADDWNLQDRLSPCGVRYQLPMTSVKDAVVEQFYKKAGEGRVLSKSQFFYDVFHPTNNGHKIMADCIMNVIRLVDEQPIDDAFDWKAAEQVFEKDFSAVKLLDKVSNIDKPISIDIGSFVGVDKDLQYAEYDDSFEGTAILPNNWQHVTGKQPFIMKINCRALLMISKDSGAADFGKARVLVDGKEVIVANPRTVGWTHCHPQILFYEEESKEHTVEISMVPEESFKLFTILGFGYVD